MCLLVICVWGCGGGSVSRGSYQGLDANVRGRLWEWAPYITKGSRIRPRSPGLNGRYFYLLNHFASHQISLLWHRIIPDVNIISRLSIRTLNYIVFISVHITGCLLRDALLMSQSKVSLVLLDGSYYVMIFVGVYIFLQPHIHTQTN